MIDFAIQPAAIMAPVVSDPNRVEALRNRVALYRSYLRVGVRGDFAIQYMRQIADDLNEIEAVRVRRERPWIQNSVDVSLGDVSN